MVNQQRRYYRRIAETVLRWFTELETGIIQSETGPVFDSRVLDYRIDVSNIMGRFTEAEQKIVLLVHRDGCSHRQAATLAGVDSDRPDLLVEDIEVRMGQAFDRHRLGNFLAYIGYLR